MPKVKTNSSAKKRFKVTGKGPTSISKTTWALITATRMRNSLLMNCWTKFSVFMRRLQCVLTISGGTLMLHWP